MESNNAPRKLILTYLDGQKMGAKLSHDFQSGKASQIGRAPECDIQIEGGAEDVVSRKHAEILINTQPAFMMSVTDLNSTNGVFINGKRINGTIEIVPGDEIKFGQNGPNFGIDVDPRPAQVLAKTRVISVPEMQSTREIVVEEAEEFVAPEIDNHSEIQPAGVGKETVERMIQGSQKKSNLSSIILGIGTLLALGVAGYLFFRTPEAPMVVPNNNPVTEAFSPAKIIKQYGDATVRIETGWKLKHSPSGEDIYHVYDAVEIEKGQPKRVMAFYAMLPDGTIEPYCEKGKFNEYSKIVLSHGQGTGFVVDSKGFIMTNRHVAEGWQSPYTFMPDAFPGILVQVDNYGNPIPNTGSIVYEQDVQGFIPSELKRLGNSPVSNRIIDGERMYMDVMFPGDDNRWPVTSTNASSKHDVAVIRIDYAGTLETVNYEDLDPEPGDEIVLVGFPGLSGKEYFKQASKDALNQNPRILEIANPSTAAGNISKIMKGGFDLNSRISTAGNSYELTGINFTGGASGSPVFNRDGVVIAVFNSGRSDGVGVLNYAVPIKYGMELLGRKSNKR